MKVKDFMFYIGFVVFIASFFFLGYVSFKNYQMTSKEVFINFWQIYLALIVGCFIMLKSK